MIVSIDIGTSYSSICVLGPEGKALPVDIGTGTGMYGSKYSLPSAVFVDESGNVLVGQAAMNSRRRAPQNFRMEFKRDLGQDVPIILGSRSFLPKDLYTEMFRHMAKRAVQSGGEAIEWAYVTYPASFGKKKKAQIIEAANAAGLFEVELVDEPTAAAMSYVQAGLVGEEQRFLIYDFGGGTFDASLIGYRQGRFYSLAEPVGLEHCGGIDIDRKIYEDMLGHLDPDMLALVNKTPINRMRLDSQLAELAIKAKHHLSAAPDFYEDIQVGFDLVPYQLGADALNVMISPLAGQTIEACRRLLKNAGMTVSQLSAILMVGGTSRVPLVQSFVRQFAGDVAVRSSVDLELAVAQGALGFYKGTASREDAAPEPKTAAPLPKAQQFQPKICSGGTRISAYLQNSGNVVPFLLHSTTNTKVRSWRDIVDISTDPFGESIVGLRKDGRAVAAGVNDFGQCNVDGWQDVASLVHRPPKNMFIGIKKDGTIVAAGDKYPGYIQELSRWKDIISVDCGYSQGPHIVGLREDGTVTSVGTNQYGKGQVSEWKDIVQVACGYHHTVGLKKDGSVVAAGKNVWNEGAVTDWHDVVALACGPDFTVGLCADGTVLATGDNRHGQCNVASWENVIQIACGNCHTVALLKDGTVVATGGNQYGQCNVSKWRYVTHIFAGDCYTAGVLEDGTLLQNKWKTKERTVVVRRHVFAPDETKTEYDIVKEGTKVFEDKLF